MFLSRASPFPFCSLSKILNPRKILYIRCHNILKIACVYTNVYFKLESKDMKKMKKEIFVCEYWNKYIIVPEKTTFDVQTNRFVRLFCCCFVKLIFLFRSVPSFGIGSSAELGMPRNECFLPRNNGNHSESIPRNFFGTKFRSQPYWCFLLIHYPFSP